MYNTSRKIICCIELQESLRLLHPTPPSSSPLAAASPTPAAPAAAPAATHARGAAVGPESKFAHPATHRTSFKIDSIVNKLGP